jgi:hypothetical protein
LVSTPPWCQKPKRSSGSLMERGNRQAQEADRASHPHIGTRWRCFVLLRSHARAASRIPSEQLDSVAGSPTDRYPNSGIFFGCCATAMTATARSTTAIRIDGTAALFIADLVSSVMYHADRDKGKCDLHGGSRQVLVEWEGQNQPEIELNDASV